jgi:hypothetical protein
MSKLELFKEKLDGLVHFYQRAEVNLDEFRNMLHIICSNLIVKSIY